ncbi:MAG: TRAP transporter large permease [Parasporobacterium sp.]|nr:TRAP transporter large permease [Parasporobacterium sp.]
MSPELIGVLGIVVLLILLALKMWVGAALAIVGFVGIIILKNFTVAMTVLGTAPFNNINSYSFTVIPLFTLMGCVIAETTMGIDLYAAVRHWLGHFRGGLASATVVACGVLGAICGSSNTGVMIMSRIALPEMEANKYDESFACGSTAAGAPLALLIPPSMGFMMYGIITENSISKLFMSGIGVGVVQIILYIVLIWILCRIFPKYGPQGPKATWKQRFKSLLKVIPIILLMLLVLGGIYLGWFTTTEAGAIGAFGSIVISIIFRQCKVKNLWKAFKDTAVLIGMIFFLLASTYIFVQFMTMSHLPTLLANVIMGLTVPKWVLSVALILLYLILGMFLPEVPMLVLTMPVLYPALTAIGFDPIWLGCFVVKLMALGSISPPVGMTVYTMSGVTRKPVEKIFKGVIPFIIMDVVILALMIIFPQLATFIPDHMH